MKNGRVSENDEILNGRPIESYTYDYRGNTIWGATARIVKKLLDIIGGIKDEKDKIRRPGRNP